MVAGLGWAAKKLGFCDDKGESAGKDESQSQNGSQVGGEDHGDKKPSTLPRGGTVVLPLVSEESSQSTPASPTLGIAAALKERKEVSEPSNGGLEALSAPSKPQGWKEITMSKTLPKGRGITLNLPLKSPPKSGLATPLEGEGVTRSGTNTRSRWQPKPMKRPSRSVQDKEAPNNGGVERPAQPDKPILLSESTGEATKDLSSLSGDEFGPAFPDDDLPSPNLC